MSIPKTPLNWDGRVGETALISKGYSCWRHFQLSLLSVIHLVTNPEKGAWWCIQQEFLDEALGTQHPGSQLQDPFFRSKQMDQTSQGRAVCTALPTTSGKGCSRCKPQLIILLIHFHESKIKWSVKTSCWALVSAMLSLLSSNFPRWLKVNLEENKLFVIKLCCYCCP